MNSKSLDKVTFSESPSHKSSRRGEKCLAKFTSANGSVYGSLILDIRKAGDYDQELPVAVRICYDSQKVFLRLGSKYTMPDWISLCEYEKSGRRIRLAERNELKDRMDNIELLTNQLILEGTFSLKKLKDCFQGRKDENYTIYSIWDDYLQTKKTEGKAGSARCSKDVKCRFIKDMGNNVALADIDRKFVQEWVGAMRKGGLNATTIAIDLRSFRTIVNIAIDRGLINGNTKEMFKDTGYNKSQSRKHEFLDVATMRKLYEFWEAEISVDAAGKELFFPKEKYAIFRDLGLFLFMYLGDGQNLADTLRLTYDGWYFATHGKQLRFLRHKTRDRNESASEVIFSITPELQKIIDKYGNKPEQGKRVFPIMSEFITPEKEVWVIQRYNRYIREHMAKIAELLKMEQRPTATWARHSFATNLNNSGAVPYKYISDSMGHSSSGDITSNYIGAYPLEKMLEYNWFLLNDAKKNSNHNTNKQALLALLKNMTEIEREELLSSI